MTADVRDLASEVTDLRARVDQLRHDNAVAVARADAAEEEASRLLAQLKASFGVDSVEAGQALLLQLDARIATEVDSIRLQLSETGTVQ